MEKNNSFEKQVKIGTKGEKAFEDYCKNHNIDYVDVTKDEKYQKIDVDFILNNSYYAEVKTDNLIHKTNNFPIELIHHRKTGDKEGWYYYCKAYYIIRCSPITNKLYILYFDKCKDNILDKYKNRERKWWDKEDKNYVTGLLLNVDDLIDQGYLKVIDM